jgi:hypothetical protein
MSVGGRTREQNSADETNSQVRSSRLANEGPKIPWRERSFPRSWLQQRLQRVPPLRSILLRQLERHRQLVRWFQLWSFKRKEKINFN